ncbi:MAG: alpha/beta hydrolase [Anaerofustis stercorihominis]|nr:alpha/beta hydrolase [Anaerofustis stercorihominis]
MKAVEYGKENKDVILLLHGGGLSWWNYKGVAELLSGRFHIVIPILDGHPGSDAPFTSIESNAKEIISYIDENFGSRVLLIGGLSLGGQVLLEILSRRCDICGYAIIESALAIPMKITAALIKPVYSICYPLIKQRWFAKLQFKALHIKDELFEDYYKDTSDISRRNMTSFLTANSGYQIKDTLRDCKAKALVLVGGKERRIMKRSAKQVAGIIPGAQSEVLKNYYHGDLSINHPEEYAEKLLQLINT